VQLKGGQDGFNRPEEYPRIPEELSAFIEDPGQFKVRFLGKCLDFYKVPVFTAGLAGTIRLYVTVTGFRA
jgi:hypothetical protein